MTGLGITGTDTNVGKTVVTTALVSALYERGVRVAAMKPVESGGTDDGDALRKAAGNVFPTELVTPVLLAEPLAPLVAARRAHRTIDIETLDTAFHTLRRESEIVVVEGAGGLLVPITRSVHFGTLFHRWALDVVIVAANRLGAVNHTLLTVDSARAQGLTVRAVVLNTVRDGSPSIADQTNQVLIQELRDVPVLPFPYLHGATRTAQHRAAGHALASALFGELA